MNDGTVPQLESTTYTVGDMNEQKNKEIIDFETDIILELLRSLNRINRDIT